MITYDEFRSLEYPIELVKQYYSNNLKKGEYLWWLDQDKSIPISLSILNEFPKTERIYFLLEGLAIFPEILSNKSNKYNNFIIHLLNKYSIISHNIRDLYSAGGQIEYKTASLFFKNIPRIFNLLIDYTDLFLDILFKLSEQKLLLSNLDISTKKEKLLYEWIEIASFEAKSIYKDSYNLINAIFFK